MKKYLRKYIDKWEDITEVEKKFPNDYSLQMINELKIKIETFEYLLHNGIDENFE